MFQTYAKLIQRYSARIQDIFDMDSTEGTLMISLNLMILASLALGLRQYLFPPK